MDTYLLAWNPNRWVWVNLDNDRMAVRRGGSARQRWSCGKVTHIAPGSRFFLIRLGQEPKGIIGSGRIASAPYKAAHWDLTRESGATALFVDVDFDSLSSKPLIDWGTLNSPPLEGFHWATQMSGIKIPSIQSAALEKLWRSVTPVKEIAIPEEVLEGIRFQEGALKKIQVNVYERDARARAACIEHYGHKCSVCDFDFEKVYGEIGVGYIHVHHLIPLSKIVKEYSVDPVKDLRPVCANCHAVIHLRTIPFTIEEVKRFMKGSG
jgi:5-methylcytosine-specific restriction protein A